MATPVIRVPGTSRFSKKKSTRIYQSKSHLKESAKSVSKKKQRKVVVTVPTSKNPLLSFKKKQYVGYFTLMNQCSEAVIVDVRTPLPRKAEIFAIEKECEESRWNAFRNQWTLREILQKPEDASTVDVTRMIDRNEMVKRGMEAPNPATAAEDAGLLRLQTGESRKFELRRGQEVEPGAYGILIGACVEENDGGFQGDDMWEAFTISVRVAGPNNLQLYGRNLARRVALAARQGSDPLQLLRDGAGVCRCHDPVDQMLTEHLAEPTKETTITRPEGEPGLLAQNDEMENEHQTDPQIFELSNETSPMTQAEMKASSSSSHMAMDTEKSHREVFLSPVDYSSDSSEDQDELLAPGPTSSEGCRLKESGEEYLTSDDERDTLAQVDGGQDRGETKNVWGNDVLEAVSSWSIFMYYILHSMLYISYFVFYIFFALCSICAICFILYSILPI